MVFIFAGKRGSPVSGSGEHMISSEKESCSQDGAKVHWILYSRTHLITDTLNKGHNRKIFTWIPSSASQTGSLCE